LDAPPRLLGTPARLIVVAVAVVFAGYLLWELSGRIEKVHMTGVDIIFRGR